MSEGAPDFKPYRVAAVQMEPKLGAIAANRDAIIKKIGEAGRAGARLIVFPECALTGYGFGSRDEALPYAEPVPGPSLLPITYECARADAYAILGMLERDGDQFYNACVLVGRGGVIGSYRKIHLPFLGVDRFADPGNRALAVQDAGGVRVGMHICYDGGFPETGRVLTLLGADILVLPTNWPTHSECAAEHQMACRAIENHVYAMAVNRVGEERGFRFIGRSSIVAPGGRVLATAGPDSQEVLYADIDPMIARKKHLVRVPKLHEIDRIADRRPEFYGPLVAPNRRP